MVHHLSNLRQEAASLLSSVFSIGNNGNGKGDNDEDRCSLKTKTLEAHFASLPYTLEAWQLIQKNDPTKTVCNLNGCDFLPSSAWKEMGEILATNTHVIEFYAENCQLSDDNFDALMTGLQANRSIKTLNFQNNPDVITSASVLRLSTHLQTRYCKKNLVVLALCRTNLDDRVLRNLLSGLNDTRIRQLFLNNNLLGANSDKLRVKENLSYCFHRINMPDLEELYLVENELGREGCEAIQYLLRNDNTRLKHLSLFRNRFDDCCCRILAEGLKDNTTLDTIYIGANGSNGSNESLDSITSKGWQHFLQLVCDDESIQSTYTSNHVVHDLGDVDSIRARPALTVSSYIPLVLEAILAINASPVSDTAKGRRKVAMVHFNGDYSIEELLQLDIKLMPRVLEFLAECSLQEVNHLFRNMPSLLDYYCPT